MNKNLENTKTKECLIKAFFGESGARNKYTYYASIAKKEGYEQIAGFFLETADNEKEHAKIFLKHLGKDFENAKIKDASYPIGLSESTLLNLEYSIKGEYEEYSILYPLFENISKEEGFNEISKSFHEIAEVEKVHEKRFKDLYQNLKENKVFKKNKEVIWKCRNCGYHHKGKEAPAICPSCKHPISYFELFIKNY